MPEYTLKELSIILKLSEGETKKIINDLLLTGLLEKNGEKFKQTKMGVDFMRFISRSKWFWYYKASFLNYPIYL